MRAIERNVFVCIIGLFLFWASGSAFADDAMTLVVNPADQSNSQQFVDYLTANEISVEFCAPADFDLVKDGTYLTIMGGVDDDAIRKLVVEAVGEEEAALLGDSKTGKMYYKEGVWAPDQKVMIFTGSDSDAAIEARKAARRTWVPYIEEWFELEGPEALKSY